MRGLVARASARHFTRHPWQLALALIGVAAGVAMAVGIDVSLASVRRSFALSSEAITGTATSVVVGGPDGLDEELYRVLRTATDRPPGLVLSPVVAGFAAPATGGGLLQVVGLDPWAGGPPSQLSSFSGALGAGPSLAPLLLVPGGAVLGEATAARLGLHVGSQLPVRAAAHQGVLTLIAVAPARDARERAATDGLVLVDLASAQELLGMVGHLSRLDVTWSAPTSQPASRGASGDAAEAAAWSWLRARLPAGVRLEAVAARQGALAELTRAFDLNLRALSLLALLVGAFLVFNTMSFSVVQRRPLLAILRTLGATREELGRNLLLEAACLGAVGSVVGVLGGWLLARGLVQLVARAVSDLYFAIAVNEVPVAPWSLVRGFALGVVAAVVSAIPAARDATRTEPTLALHRSAVELASRRRAPRAALAGLALVAVAAAIVAFSGRNVAVGLGAMLLGLMGTAATTPAVVALGARAAVHVLGRWRGATGRFAARSITAGLSRTGVASAALALALSVTTGVGLMVSSFRAAVADWLGLTLQADVYVSAPSSVSARAESPLPPSVLSRLAGLPAVAGVITSRVVTVPIDGQPTLLVVTGSAPARLPAAQLRAGDARAVWPAYVAGEGVLASEALAFKRGLAPGAVVTVASDRGPLSWRVLGVYQDYGSDAGTVMAPRPLYEQSFRERGVTGLGLFAAPGIGDEALVAAARAALLPGEEVVVRSQRVLREHSLEVFDRTFAITKVLRTFAIVVASFGVASALMAVALERSRAFATLRALGATPGQVAEMTLLETGVLGLFSGVLALPAGGLLAVVLVFVINRRSFGWTMSLVADVPALAVAPALGLAAGLLGGLYPASRAARSSPAEALREE